MYFEREPWETGWGRGGWGVILTFPWTVGSDFDVMMIYSPDALMRTFH